MANCKECAITYDEKNGFLSLDGVKFGRIQYNGGRLVFQVFDKDRRRSQKRGTRFVAIDLESLTTFIETLDVIRS